MDTKNKKKTSPKWHDQYGRRKACVGLPGLGFGQDLSALATQMSSQTNGVHVANGGNGEEEEEDVPIKPFGKRKMRDSIVVNKEHLKHIHEHARPSHNSPAGSAHAANVAADAAEAADHHHHVHYTEPGGGGDEEDAPIKPFGKIAIAGARDSIRITKKRQATQKARKSQGEAEARATKQALAAHMSDDALDIPVSGRLLRAEDSMLIAKAKRRGSAARGRTAKNAMLAGGLHPFARSHSHAHDAEMQKLKHIISTDEGADDSTRSGGGIGAAGVKISVDGDDRARPMEEYQKDVGNFIRGDDDTKKEKAAPSEKADEEGGGGKPTSCCCVS